MRAQFEVATEAGVAGSTSIVLEATNVPEELLLREVRKRGGRLWAKLVEEIDDRGRIALRLRLYTSQPAAWP